MRRSHGARLSVRIRLKGRAGPSGFRASQSCVCCRRESGRAPPSSKSGSSRGIEALLRALEGSLSGGSLEGGLKAHEDVQGELTELMLGVYAVSPAASGTGETARAVLMQLLLTAGHGGAGNPVVLRALLPLLTMKPSRAGLPCDARSRTSAHNKAVQVRARLRRRGGKLASECRASS